MGERDVAESRGCLETVTIDDDGKLKINGWVASFDAGGLEGFRIVWGGRPFPRFQLTRGIGSPDVKRTYPDLENAGNCRFGMLVPLERDQPPSPLSSLIELTPIFGRGPGRPLFAVLEPVLPLPNDTDMGTVGHLGDFMVVSFEFLGYFIRRAGLTPTQQILDVGCGVGRMAYSLVHYLEFPGRYEGFDVVERLVSWCQKTITPRFSNFQFQYVDLYNALYNPGGKEKSTEFRFPYESDRFDLVSLTSVFTHLRGAEVRHYLDEIYRVLKPGGQVLCTAFLLNDESRAGIAKKRSTHGPNYGPQDYWNLIHEKEDFFTAEPDRPEDSIGFDEPLILRWIEERKLRIKEKHYGYWCGRMGALSCQDMLILTKDEGQ